MRHNSTGETFQGGRVYICMGAAACNTHVAGSVVGQHVTQHVPDMDQAMVHESTIVAKTGLKQRKWCWSARSLTWTLWRHGAAAAPKWSIIPCISGGHQSFRSMWRSSSQTTMGVGNCPLKQGIKREAPPPASVPPRPSPCCRAAKRRCLPETLPANSPSPQSNLMRQVGLRRRRLQQYGHLDRGSRPRAALSREFRRSPRYQEDLLRDSGDLPFVGQPSWNPSQDRSKIGPSVGAVPQQKVLRRRVWACRFQKAVGRSKGMKEIPRVVQACRVWHRLNPAKSRLQIAWLVVTLLTNEMMRLWDLAAAQATAFTYASHLHPSEATRVCQDQAEPPVRVAALPRDWSVLLHRERTGHELQSERVRRERPVGQSRVQIPRAYAQETPESGEALLVPSLRYLNWTTVSTTAACNPRFTAALRTKLALPFAKKKLLGQLQWATSVGEGRPAFHNCSRRFHLKNSSGPMSIARGFLSCCRSAPRQKK